MRQAEQIHGTFAILEQSLQRGFGAVLHSEIAEEGVAGADRNKAERDAGICSGVSEDAIEDFVGGAVAADSDETAIVLRVGFAGELGGVTGSCGADPPAVKAVLAKPRDGRSGEFSPAAAAGS